ncbi:MAG: hypothetical protein GY856_01125 [bacterium]|nr:hypothetical protein [bacterium]
MTKSAVYSWRLSPDLKLALEEAARESRESVGKLLEQISREWLARRSSRDDGEEQRHLHAAAAGYFGTVEGGDPDRAAKAREMLRERLARRRRHGS